MSMGDFQSITSSDFAAVALLAIYFKPTIYFKPAIYFDGSTCHLHRGPAFYTSCEAKGLLELSTKTISNALSD